MRIKVFLLSLSLFQHHPLMQSKTLKSTTLCIIEQVCFVVGGGGFPFFFSRPSCFPLYFIYNKIL